MKKTYLTHIVARKCGVTVRSVQKWAAANDVPYKGEGKSKIYFWTEDLVKAITNYYAGKRERRNSPEEWKRAKEKEIERTLNWFLHQWNTDTYTSKETAAICHVSIRTVQKYAKENNIPCDVEGKRKKYVWTISYMDSFYRAYNGLSPRIKPTS